jgi:hypothetical protein
MNNYSGVDINVQGNGPGRAYLCRISQPYKKKQDLFKELTDRWGTQRVHPIPAKPKIKKTKEKTMTTESKDGASPAPEGTVLPASPEAGAVKDGEQKLLGTDTTLVVGKGVAAVDVPPPAGDGTEKTPPTQETAKAKRPPKKLSVYKRMVKENRLVELFDEIGQDRKFTDNELDAVIFGMFRDSAHRHFAYCIRDLFNEGWIQWCYEDNSNVTKLLELTRKAKDLLVKEKIPTNQSYTTLTPAINVAQMSLQQILDLLPGLEAIDKKVVEVAGIGQQIVEQKKRISDLEQELKQLLQTKDQLNGQLVELIDDVGGTAVEKELRRIAAEFNKIHV